MKKIRQSFLELAEDIFYNFSQIPSGRLNLIFSKQILFPVMRCDSELEIVIPLPRKLNEKYLFEGMIFDDSVDGRRNLWCLFLTTVYHLAAHACVSRYSKYDSWKKFKTEDVCLRIIDYVEDMYVEKYIAHTDSEIWKNMKNIELKLMPRMGMNSRKSWDVNDLKFLDASNEEIIAKMRINATDNSDDAILFASWIYRNRGFLSQKILPYCERHDIKQTLHTPQKSPDFEPYGLFQENIVKLDELWMTDTQLKSKMLLKYQKNLKDLN